MKAAATTPATDRLVIEWTPGKWWVVDERKAGYTPLFGPATKAEAEEWLRANPLPKGA